MNRDHYITKPAKPARDGLFVAFTCMGLTAGLFARDLLDTTEAKNEPIEQLRTAEPLQVTVYAVVEVATRTPEPSPTPKPFFTATPRLDFCDTPVPGDACRVPIPSPTVAPPPTPFPDCYDVMSTPENAAVICVWHEGSL